MEQQFDQDETGGLEANGQGLNDETGHVEPQLAIGCQGDTARDHADNGKQPAIGFLDAEHEGDQENGYWCECLQHLDERHG